MHFPNISIESSYKESCPKVRIGCLWSTIEVREEDPSLWKLIEQSSESIGKMLDNSKVQELPTIAAARQAYKALGKDPSRYRPSAESLLRRLVGGKGLYSVNNVVNLLNWISVQTGFSIGGYDATKINGAIRLSVGSEEDEYEGLGRGILNISSLPVLRDETGAFGCPTSDSTRTGILPETTQCLWVFFDFGADENLENILTQSSKLLEEHAKGINFHSKIIEL